ncbi:MAG: malate synthase A, partial [Pontibacter sp.]|nr:malate synthase A [Pontibacter sp.]
MIFESTVEIKGNLKQEFESILTPEALEFLEMLHHKFDARRKELLQLRVERQKA